MSEYNIAWDNANRGSGVELSNNNLTATIPNSSNTVRASSGRDSGKWYWEIKLDILDMSSGAMIGIVDENADLNAQNFNTQNVRYYYSSNGRKYPEGVGYGTSFGAGQIIGVALDLDNGTLEFFEDGVSHGVSHIDIKNMGVVYPAVSSGSSTGGNMCTAHFESDSFVYDAPEGYLSYGFSYANKILIQSSSGEIKSISKIEYTDNLIPVMMSNTEPSGIASASNIYSGGHDAWMAFDGTDSRWQTNVNVGWLQYRFETKRNIQQYSILINSIAQAPQDWTFEGSNDGVNWDVLDSQVGVTDWTQEDRFFSFKNSNFYNYYRINVSKNNGNNYLSIREMKMMGSRGMNIVQLPSQTDQSFINHGMDDLSGIDFNADIVKKQYIQNQSTPLSSGKVFEQPIDAVKYRIKKISFE